MTDTTTLTDIDLVEAILARIAKTLAVMDGDFSYGELTVARKGTRPAGENQIHISYKIAFRYGESEVFGSFLLPVSEAATLAGMLMMLPQESIQQIRASAGLAAEVREAVLELGNLIGGAVDYSLHELLPDAGAARFRGCQGVRANVRPAFPYEEGQTLLVGRALGRIGDHEEFPLLFMMPLPPGM